MTITPAREIAARLLLLVVALGFVCAARSAGISVVDHPDWRPASEAQRSALAAATPGCLVIDFSLRTGGGAGSILQSPAKPEVNRQVVENFVSGYIKGVRESGQTIVSRSPASVGKLKGVCVTSKAETNGRAVGVVTYIVFSNRDSYSISIYGPSALTPADPLVGRYLARIQIDPAVVAGDIESDSAFERGRKFGSLFTRVIFAIGLGLVAVVTVMAVLRRHRESKPPPLPGA